MTKRHDIGYYLDGRVSVAFCKVCSAEGEKLFEDCPQIIEIELDDRGDAFYITSIENEE